MRIPYRLRRSLEKNTPEVKAILTGRMPRFVFPLGASSDDGPAVFNFHDVEPKGFSAQLEFLRANGYRTLDADELAERIRLGSRTDEREVALTFDDATWTFWTYAFPLLEQYEFKAILFAVPGVLSNDESSNPDWEDAVAGRCEPGELAERGRRAPFCTWRELRLMHDSGAVDVQSHSLTHARVPVSPRIVDFIHPAFDPYYGNFDIPLARSDDPDRPERALRLGAPLFDSSPRTASRPRFWESAELVEQLTAAAAFGGDDFFDTPGWRRALAAVLGDWPPERRGQYETPDEMRTAVTRELTESRAWLERALPNKSVRHFCYPWFVGSHLADTLAADAGYGAVYYGPDVDTSPLGSADRLLRVQRIGSEYIHRLPGRGRRGLWSICSERLRGAPAAGLG